MNTGFEPGTTETYMMSGVGSIPNVTIIPPPVGIELMGNELPPEYIFDQGLSYPSAENYGYLCTGYESPCEWGDHHSIFWLDGQDLHYMGLQAESLPYVYYTPGYGYSQTPFNQYSSYVPDAVTGLDGPFVGAQQYLNISSYQRPISSPAYIPVVVQPSSDFVLNSSIEPFPFSTGASIPTRPANAGAKIMTPQASLNAAASSQLATSTTPLVIPDTSRPLHNNQAVAKPSEGLQINIPPSNQSSLHEAMMYGSGTHGHQVVSSGLMQPTYQFSHGRTPFVQNHVKVAAPSSSSLTNCGSNDLGWASQDKLRQGPQFKDIADGVGRNLDVLGEQNNGPRKNRLKDRLTQSGVESAELTKKGASVVQGGCIIISSEHYNKDDFPVDYPDAKFFVIKSYSEDDVHKSIKYNVWSSTHNGNRRLDSAYEDAQRKYVGKPRKCPVFLFFSVNASGQFCGLAEMVGPVDFDKDMNFWQQDKWSGSFPLKWHLIKDVPNASLRHILLENNENKPVTTSRDTQQIPYSAGINMLKNFKTSLLQTSILDDFMFYEERQKKMLEDKFRHLGSSYNASLYVPAFVSPKRSDGKADQPPTEDEYQPSGAGQTAQVVGHQTGSVSEQPSKYKEKMQHDTVTRPSKIDGEHLGVAFSQSQKTDRKQLGAAVGLSPEADGKHSTGTEDLPPIANGMQQCKVAQPSNVDALQSTANQSRESDEKHSSFMINQLTKAETEPTSLKVLPKVDGKQSKWRISQPPKSDGNNPRPEDINGVAKAGLSREQFKKKMHASDSSAGKNTEPDLATCDNGTKAIIKAAVPSVDTKQGAAAISLGTMELEVISTDFVIVGSMQIKVKDLGESSSRLVSVGTVTTDYKGSKPSKDTSAGSQQPKK